MPVCQLAESTIDPLASLTPGYKQRVLSIAFILTILGVAATSSGQTVLDGFNPGANGQVSAVVAQPDGKILVGGAFTRLGGGGSGATDRQHIGRLKPDGTLDSSFDPGSNGVITAVALQADGKIVVGGDFTMLGGGGSGSTVRNHIARLNADGSLDSTFNPGANDTIDALAVQPDGKIIVGGKFTALGGGSGVSARHRIGRLNTDGTLDAGFDPGANGDVLALLVQPNLKILVGGAFTSLGGGGSGSGTRNRIARLNADGSVDAGFNPGADASVAALAVQADGRILVGGLFTALGGGSGVTSRHFLGRIAVDGSVDSSFDPGANGGVSVVVVEADGKILVGGAFDTLGGGGFGTTGRHHFGRLKFDGSLDSSFDPGADGDVLSVAVQADGEIVVGGAFTAMGGGATGTTARNALARLTPGGWIDTELNPGANGYVEAMAVQVDGKIVIAGAFTTLGVSSRSRIARLNPDGSLDASFNPATDGQVNTVAVQPDGKIILGGDFFGLVGGSSRSAIARLNPDGSVDAGFNPGANGFINALAVQRDGKILVGGTFTMVGGGGFGATPRNNLARLNADGTVDVSFDPDLNGRVTALTVQPDGKILIGGAFTTLGGGGTSRNRIARLNADGSPDPDFNPGANNLVYSLVVQPDGGILVGGAFTTLGGGGTGVTARYRIARLHADGTLDVGFDPGADQEVFTIATQADGKILVGGGFSLLGGGGSGTTMRQWIGRLNADGSLDATFTMGADFYVFTILPQADGHVLVGGAFQTLYAGNGPAPRSFVGRFPNTAPATDRLDVTNGGAVVAWSRGGAAPELDRTTFELSTDGETFAPLANASRIAGGWQLTGQSLPTQQNLFIRARGYWSSAQFNGVSGSAVESIRNAFVSCPVIGITSLPAGVAGIPYGVPLTTSGAIGVVAFGIAGALPAGVFLSDGTLSGMPLQFGSFPITLSATDSASGCAAPPQSLTLTIAEPTITLSATSFAAGTAGVAYPTTTITQSGGIGTATFGVISGSLPSGMSLSASGIVTGTPLMFGTFNFTVRATDVNGSTGSRSYALVVAEPTITLSATVFPTGTQDVAYSAVTISSSGGIGISTFVVSGGALPAGLSLSSAGIVDGTPTMVGVFSFTLTATDINGSHGSRAYSATIQAQAIPTFTKQPGGRAVPERSPVTFTVTATGAPTPTYRWQSSADGTSWQDLGDAATYSGVLTDTLTISSAPASLDGTRFRAIASNVAGSATSTSATLNVTAVFLSRAADFDGDGRADVALFRPVTGVWRILNSRTGLEQSLVWGGDGDFPVPGDYDGDGRADLAVFRPSNGTWYIRNSSTGSMTTFLWGGVGDAPAPGDYDGDGLTDIAVFRVSNGTWYIRHSGTGALFGLLWGGGNDIGVAADYDADGLTDIAVYRPTTGTWYVRYSNTGAGTALVWGGGNDVPVPGDFDGDGRADVAVFRPSTGIWYIRNSNTGIDEGLLWGGLGDDAVPADYDADGKADMAVFRPSTETWYLRNSSTGVPTVVSWGGH